MSDAKKYELLRNKTKEALGGTLLYQIHALRDISDAVKMGDCGGYVASESNLSHSGKSWIYDNMQVNKRKSIVWFSNVGSEYGTLTVAARPDGDAYVTRGCFSGTLLEFLEAVNTRHRDSRIGHEYHALIAVACSRLGIQRPSSITPVGGGK